jgi:hypothetical protein
MVSGAEVSVAPSGGAPVVEPSLRPMELPQFWSRGEELMEQAPRRSKLRDPVATRSHGLRFVSMNH